MCGSLPFTNNPGMLVCLFIMIELVIWAEGDSKSSIDVQNRVEMCSSIQFHARKIAKCCFALVTILGLLRIRIAIRCLAENVDLSRHMANFFFSISITCRS